VCVRVCVCVCVCSDCIGCEGEEVAMSGVVLTQQYLSKALSHLQATQSDSIGAPKVNLKGHLYVHFGIPLLSLSSYSEIE